MARPPAAFFPLIYFRTDSRDCAFATMHSHAVLALSNRLKPQKKWTKAGTTIEAANGTGVALSPGNKAILFVKRDSSNNREVTAMNVRNAFSRRSSVTPNTRARSRSTRRRKASSASPGKTWFKSGGATPDYDLREVVAQRFMSMNEAHDRIRNELLASRSLETN